MSATTSDMEGKFVFENLSIPSYTLNVSYLGFRTVQKEVTLNGNTILDPIILENGAVGLEQVTVKGVRKAIKVEHGAITTRIEGSLLSREHHTTDVLAKVPGVKYNGEELSVIGLGNPEIYINGRKVEDNSELERITPENISTIKLITNPGSEYSAATKSVILIKTKGLHEGFMVRANGMLDVGHRLSQSEGFNMSYQKGKIDLFATSNYRFGQGHSIHNDKRTLHSDTLWTLDQKNDNIGKTHTHTYSTGINYNISEKTDLGIKYDARFIRAFTNFPDQSTLFADGIMQEKIHTISDYPIIIKKNHVNLYFSSDFHPQWEYKLYADYLHNEDNRDQHTEEYGTTYTDTTNIINRNNNDLYGIRTFLKYHMDKYGIVTLGYEFSDVVGDGNITENTALIENSDYTNIELKNAPFLSYDVSPIHNVDFYAGIRYEQVKYDYSDALDSKNNVNRLYKNWFPSAGVTYHGKLFTQSFNFSQKVERPSFYDLTSNTFYKNKYSIQATNPLLVQEIDYHYEYKISYKNSFMSLLYQNCNDYLSVYKYSDPNNEPSFIQKTINYDNVKYLTFTAYTEHKMGIYTPRVTFIVEKPFFDAEVMGINTEFNKPMYDITVDNYIKTNNHWLFNVNYNFTSKSNSLYMLCSSNHYLSFSVKKSFFHDQLAVDVFARNVVNEYIERYTYKIENITGKLKIDPDIRKYGFSLVYTFNHYKDVYKGENTAQDEIDRL